MFISFSSVVLSDSNIATTTGLATAVSNNGFHSMSTKPGNYPELILGKPV
jgi:hypothetical protein